MKTNQSMFIVLIVGISNLFISCEQEVPEVVIQKISSNYVRMPSVFDTIKTRLQAFNNTELVVITTKQQLTEYDEGYWKLYEVHIKNLIIYNLQEKNSIQYGPYFPSPSEIMSTYDHPVKVFDTATRNSFYFSIANFSTGKVKLIGVIFNSEELIQIAHMYSLAPSVKEQLTMKIDSAVLPITPLIQEAMKEALRHTRKQ